MTRITAFIFLAACISPYSGKAQFHEVSDSVVPFSFYISSMPAYYRSVTSIEVLADSLKSPVEMTRIRAAYRMAEPKNASAVPFLIEAYENEPIRKVVTDSPAGFRYYALVAIGAIGGQEARSFIRGLANDFFVAKTGYTWAQGDALDIMLGLFDGMSQLGGQEDASLLLSIFANEDYTYNTRKFAYTAYARIVYKADKFPSNREGFSHY